MTEPAPPPPQPPAPAKAPSPRGDALVAELRWVHDMIRRDLATVRQMADEVTAGLPAAEVRAGLSSLASRGPLWQLRINCQHYCRFVHAHHTAESVMLFPALRRVNPALGPGVDKLEADHVHVSGLLDEDDAAARDLGDQEDPAVRGRLTRALQNLSTDLLAHLRYEEEQISDTLRTWASWPHW